MRSNKWLILGLVLSVGINVALVGFFAGRASHGGHPRNLDPTIGFMRVLAHLSDARRSELRPLAREHLREIVPSLRQMRGSQRRLSGVIVAEPFDAQALEAALQAFRQHLGASQIASHGAFVKLVSQLTPEERRVLVEVMVRPPHQRPGHRREGAPANGKMLGPPIMESTGADYSSAHPVRRQIPGGPPPAHRDLRF